MISANGSDFGSGLQPHRSGPEAVFSASRPLRGRFDGGPWPTLISSDNREGLRAEIEELKATIARNSSDNQTLMLSLIQSLNKGNEAIVEAVGHRKKGKVYVDKPGKFEGATGDEIKSWLRRWETYFG